MTPREDGLAAAAGKVDVEQDDVGDPLVDELDGGVDLVGLADHLDGLAQLGPHPGPEHGVVVDQEDPRPPRPVAHVTSSRRGIDSSTSAPSPGAERMTTDPPNRAMRARIDLAMPWRSSGTASGSKPWPRSRT